MNGIKKYGGIPLVESHRIGYVLLMAGKKDEAEYYIDQQIKYGLESIKLGRSNSKDKTAHYDLAAAYALKGDKGKAYQHLDELNKKKTHPLYGINLIKHDPLFNSLREEPRFQAIVKNMEAKYQAEHDRVGKWLEEQGML